MLLGKLAASLLGSELAGKGVLGAGEETNGAATRVRTTGHDF